MLVQISMFWLVALVVVNSVEYDYSGLLCHLSSKQNVTIYCRNVGQDFLKCRRFQKRHRILQHLLLIGEYMSENKQGVSFELNQKTKYSDKFEIMDCIRTNKLKNLTSFGGFLENEKETVFFQNLMKESTNIRYLS